MKSLLTILMLLQLTLASAAHGETDYFSQAPRREVIEHNRTTKQKTVVLALIGAGVATSALAGAAHLDSRNKSNEVSTSDGRLSGRIYTREVDAKVDDTHRSRNLAIAGYSVGGALLIAGLTAYFLTDPGREVVDAPPLQANFFFSPDGVMGCATWNF